ncbi:hypothetical protein BH09BAC1_BH09BAC1_14340 [soil metagenome]
MIIIQPPFKPFDTVINHQIIYKGDKFLTHPRLKEKGIGICSECGYANAVENTHCNGCSDVLFILIDHSHDIIREEATATDVLDIKTVLMVVAKAYNMDWEQLTQHTKRRKIVEPRHMAIRLILELISGETFSSVARFFNSDRASIRHAIKNITALCDAYPHIQECYDLTYKILTHAKE